MRIVDANKRVYLPSNDLIGTFVKSEKGSGSILQAKEKLKKLLKEAYHEWEKEWNDPDMYSELYLHDEIIFMKEHYHINVTAFVFRALG